MPLPLLRPIRALGPWCGRGGWQLLAQLGRAQGSFLGEQHRDGCGKLDVGALHPHAHGAQGVRPREGPKWRQQRFILLDIHRPPDLDLPVRGLGAILVGCGPCHSAPEILAAACHAGLGSVPRLAPLQLAFQRRRGACKQFHGVRLPVPSVSAYGHAVTDADSDDEPDGGGHGPLPLGGGVVGAAATELASAGRLGRLAEPRDYKGPPARDGVFEAWPFRAALTDHVGVCPEGGPSQRRPSRGCRRSRAKGQG
mmetsp:Transcript_100009/g.282335  ORF Transcript_100009/g.282335 Transcript_100009/m.282335 type:complete len:253 (-) Transcript_100009:398-1156(-)